MRFSLRKCITISAFLSLCLFCSCDKHVVGELPEVQQEHLYPKPVHEGQPAGVPAHTPTAKPTPADFFPETKP
jgi:hypothetical protein